jgi:glycosyltransferase 2 family protein
MPTLAAEDVVATQVEVNGRSVTVDEVPRRRWSRHPGDVMRLLVALVALGLSLALLEWGRYTSIGLQEDISNATSSLPGFVLTVLYAGYALAAVLTPPAILVWVVVRRRWPLLGIYLLTTVTASLALDLAGSWIGARVPGLDDVPLDLTQVDLEWVIDPAWVASFAAVLTVTSPWMSRRWYRAAWIVLALLVPVRLLVGAGVPTGLLVGLAAGWAIGSAALLIFGAPSRAPSASTVVLGLDKAGLRLSTLRRASVDARGSTPYFADGVGGEHYFVKILGRDERSADLLFRVYRYLRLENVGDERPFSSLKRAVEHEGMSSVWAERAGVRTPVTVACVELDDGSMALVYQMVKGRSIDSVASEELTDEFLRGTWQQVELLREGRIAHRDLRRANVFMTEAGEPMIIDFGFGEVSASDALLDQDVAQLVLSTAVDVGAERAVAAAVAVLGRDAVRSAAPRLQTPALSGATQAALKQHKGLLEETREQVKVQAGVEEIQLAKVQRISGRRLVIMVMAMGAFWFLIPQISDIPRLTAELKDANWADAGVAIVFSILTYVGAALSLSASVTQRIPVGRTTLVTLAGSFVNRVTPAKVGGMALNLRYLQKSGVPTAVGTASIGLYSVVGMLTHICLLIIFSVWAGKSVDFTQFLPRGTILYVVLGIGAGLIGAVLFVPKIRTFIAEKVKPQAQMILTNFKGLLQHPLRLVLMVVGSAVLTLSYVGALYFSIQAFGGGIAVAVIAVVYLAGASIASAAPTPGGVGAVEAALIGGLSAAGLPSTVAVASVFLYRLATFWIPVLPGWGSFVWLERHDEV